MKVCVCGLVVTRGSGNRLMEEDGVMKIDYGVMKAGDDDVWERGGVFGLRFCHVFC